MNNLVTDEALEETVPHGRLVAKADTLVKRAIGIARLLGHREFDPAHVAFSWLLENPSEVEASGLEIGEELVLLRDLFEADEEPDPNPTPNEAFDKMMSIATAEAATCRGSSVITVDELLVGVVGSGSAHVEALSMAVDAIDEMREERPAA